MTPHLPSTKILAEINTMLSSYISTGPIGAVGALGLIAPIRPMAKAGSVGSEPDESVSEF